MKALVLRIALLVALPFWVLSALLGQPRSRWRDEARHWARLFKRGHL